MYTYLVHHFLEKSARRLPDKVALICGEERLTYKEINERADKLAAALIEMGIQRQDRVAIFLDNSSEAVIALFGILKAGGIFIMLSASMKSKKLNYILKDSGSRVLITHSNKARIVQEAIVNAPDLEDIIWCTPKGVNIIPTNNKQQTTDISWIGVISKSQALCPIPDANRCIDLDLATIIYTSGSTGDPKGVMSAHYNVISAVRSITTYLENVEIDVILCALQLSFDYGLYQILMAFSFSGTVVLEMSFGFPYKVLERLVQENVTGFPLVPTMAAILLQMNDLSKFDLSRLRYISNTAAALPVAHIKKLRHCFPTTRMYSMYGLTECKRVSYLPPEELDRRPDSVGIAMPNEEVFIVDENANALGPGEIGELVVRGSNVMQGYWNDPEKTNLVYRPGIHLRERLLYTGDHFRRDKDGFLYFIARKDDMIKTKGERVSPKEVENALCDLEGVSEAAVIGVPDEIFGQAIKAFIVRDNRNEIDEKFVLKYCAAFLEPFMIPKYIEFRDAFKKSSSGKIDKKSLK